jgi:hypothetical protein
MADVAVHLHERALVVDERVGLAQRDAEYRLFPVLDRAVRRFDVHGPPLAAVTRRAAELLDRVRLQQLSGMRAERFVSTFEAGPQHRLMAGDAAIRAPQIGDPDLLQSAWHRVRAFGAELLRHLLAERVLVIAPLVLPVADREQHGREHEQQADDRQDRTIDARVRGVGPSFHDQSLVGISGQVCHGQNICQ